VEISDLGKTEHTQRYRKRAITALVSALVLAGVVAVWFPELRQLAAYGLYVVPAHLLISFVPHEPWLFFAAKLYPPPVVATVGVLGCLAAITIDYWLIGWLVNHRFVAPKVEQSKAFKTAERYFGKAPFLLITVSAFAPVPFYPAKILAIATNYSLARFMVALVIGRFPRFWALAKAGEQVQAPTSVLVWVAVGMVAFAAWRIWARRRQRLADSS
jgi:membrane protein YqaA with SNARE-associated domain